MMIDARRRHEGIGSRLVETCLRWAMDHGAHKITCTVWPHNSPALAWYRKFGFVEEAWLRRHERRRNGQLWDGVGLRLILDWESPGSPHDS
ncbi:MAG: GNAT family N-acetyltransferase [Acidimicrobiales bacterium]|jgi:RimJ/RimL family protein N-acetyltransferase